MNLAQWVLIQLIVDYWTVMIVVAGYNPTQQKCVAEQILNRTWEWN